MTEQPDRPKRKRYPLVTEEEKLRRERLMRELNTMRGDNPPLTYRQLGLRLNRALKKVEEKERLEQAAIDAGTPLPSTPWCELPEDLKSAEALRLKVRWKGMTQEQRDLAMLEQPEAVKAAGKWPKEGEKDAKAKNQP